MAWNELDTPALWDVSDVDMLTQAMYMLMENAGVDPAPTNILAFNTTMFTPQAFISALWNRQKQFLKDSGVIIKRSSQAVTPEVSRYDLPQDWMDTRRLDFIGGSVYVQYGFPLATTSVSNLPPPPGSMTISTKIPCNPVVGEQVTLGDDLVTRPDLDGTKVTVSTVIDPSNFICQLSAPIPPYPPTPETGTVFFLRPATYALFRSDAYSLDQGIAGWMSDTGDPSVFQESSTPLLQLDIASAPQTTGTLILTYLGVPTRSAPPFPTVAPPDQKYYGNLLVVPDEFAPAVMYGALADLLNADGEGHDPKRAAYCEMRYEMGVQMAKLMLEGM